MIIKVVLRSMFLPACAFAANPFNMGKVEYFSDGKKSLRQPLEAMQKSMDWREPVLGSDGTMQYYTPPDPVLRLLNDPTPENARSYFDWQKAKTERIIKAQEVLSALESKGPQ